MDRHENLRAKEAMGSSSGNMRVAMALGRLMPSMRRLQMLTNAVGADGFSNNDAEVLIPVAVACERALDTLTRPKGQPVPADPYRRIYEVREALEVLRGFADELSNGLASQQEAGCDQAAESVGPNKRYDETRATGPHF